MIILAGMIDPHGYLDLTNPRTWASYAADIHTFTHYIYMFWIIMHLRESGSKIQCNLRIIKRVWIMIGTRIMIKQDSESSFFSYSLI